MLNTIIFDLDGTLLPMDMDIFLKQYFQELGSKFKDYFSVEELTSHIWASTSFMIKNKDPMITNEEAFFSDFFQRVSHSPEIINPLFEDFYINDFKKITPVTRKEASIQEAVAILKQKGYSLAVATNPIFPQLAINQRIEWAGFSIEDFEFITSFEKMHFCKPNIEFYQEVLDAIGKPPEACMMVGNDVEEDMVAGLLGIKTYLIEDCMISRGETRNNVDAAGSYSEFLTFVQSLPDLNR